MAEWSPSATRSPQPPRVRSSALRRSRLRQALLYIGMVLSTLPAAAQFFKVPVFGGGDISSPKPWKGNAETPAGCFLQIRRGPGLLGPPCAFRCYGFNPDVDYQAACDSIPPGTGGRLRRTEDGYKVDAPKGKPDGASGCEIYKGAPGEKTPEFYFPKGHPRCAGVGGDPHLFTFDGLRYDLQAAGEFVAAKSLDDKLEVQVRFESLDRAFDVVSVATAVAARIGDDRIMITAKTDTPLRVNGEPVELTEGEMLWRKDDGAMVVPRTRGYTLVWPDDTNLHIDVAPGRHLDLYLLAAEPRDGRLVGVVGNADGDDGSNDFRTRDGDALAAPPDFEPLYEVFAESWRISPEESLFDYGEGESTETFTDRAVPRRKATIDDLDPGARANADRLCREAGVVEPQALDQCVFDVGLTGDISFIESALALQAPADLRPDEPIEGVVIEAPVEAMAAHNIEVGIRGHEKSYWFGFAPAESGTTGRASNPYSDVFLTGDEETVRLVVPTIPGEYELRYREAGGERTILARRPFRSLEPQVRIEAPETAPAGGNLQVRLVGDLGDRMTVTVVPADSPDTTTRNPFFYLDQGTEKTSVLRGLPEQPGEYEIRCVSDWGAGQVYARHKITLTPQ